MYMLVMHQEFVLLMCVVADIVDTLINRFIDELRMKREQKLGPVPT
jgi:hypothetical protein